MKYPQSKKTAKQYADYLSGLHGTKHFPIMRAKKVKGYINFAAIKEQEKGSYLPYGWAIVE